MKRIKSLIRPGILALVLVVFPVSAAQMQTVSGHVPAAVKSLAPIGQMPPGTQLNLALGLPLRNAAALSNLLQEIYDPASPNYHHYLTPAQFTEQFGPTEQDYQALIAFAAANHLQVTGTHPNRVLLDVRGSVADVEQAFHVTLRTYQHPTENRIFYAPDTEPSLSLSLPVLHISGLDNLVLPHPLNHRLTSPNIGPAAGSGPIGTYMGRDFRNAYAPGVTLTGTGQSVGLFQLDSNFFTNDITAYEILTGLPNVPVVTVLLDDYDGGPSPYNGGNVEVSLDIEVAMAMAPGLSNIIVFEGSIPNTVLNAMAASNQVRQLSVSWYFPIDAITEQIYQQFAAQGQTCFNASGDSDAWAGTIPTPLDDPYITIVGGTTLTMNGTGTSYGSETVWNWGNSLLGPTGSGGGISTVYPIPSWQTNINMTASQGSTTMRNVPDVAMPADQIWVICNNGGAGAVAGTSCSSPLWAGFAALVNQQAAISGQPPIGFINPAIYAIASGPNYAACFHDITTGNNTSYNSPTKFLAVPGYDLCTGLGSPTGQNLINALANPDPLGIQPGSGLNAVGAAGGPFFPATSRIYSVTNNGASALTWTLSNASTWLNVSTTGGTLTPAGPASQVTVSLNTVASNLVVGTYNAVLWFTNQNDNFSASRQFTLAVIAPPVITQQPTNQAVLGETTAGFSVQVTGGLPLVYQWQLNGTNLADSGNISGSGTTNLTIRNVSAADAGTYTLTVTNFAGMEVSSNAQLTIIPSSPIIVSQPTNVTVGINGPATFSAGVIGTTPYSFQWSLNGANLPGATNAVLTLTNVQPGDSGSYVVLITNVLGSIQSSNAILVIATCDLLPSGAVAWWSAEGNAKDAVGTNNGTLQSGASFAPGELGQAFSLNGTTAYVSVLASPSLNVGVAGGMTVEGWINPQTLTNQQIILEWHKAGATNFGVYLATGSGFSSGTLFANLVDNHGNYHSVVSGPDSLVTNQFQHIAVTYDGSSGVGTLFVNGTVAGQSSLGVFTPQTSYALYLGERPGKSFNFGGMLDEMSIYNRALSESEVQAIYFARGSGKCGQPPVITQQPTNQTVVAGGTATFTVNADGSWPLNYQWSFNSTNLSNATNAALTLTSVQLTNAGEYSLLIANAAGATNSANATLTVVTPLIYNIAINPNGGVTLDFAGLPDATTRIWATTNLASSASWQPIFTNWTTTTNGTWQFIDTNTAGYPARFYRFSTP